ncbi:MAG: class I SAM-dependent methyltransferase [Putridiphycobacter sp.]|nr:class I SAM-dependent methyltransferase [Putridiphycobacter sp.]
MMDNTQTLDLIQGIDLYLLDQILKGNLNYKLQVLDAGCGSGRNLIALDNLGFDVTGFDPNPDIIDSLRLQLPHMAKKIMHSDIESFSITTQYDYIIVNAVLHFAKSHAHFKLLFSKLVELLAPKGQIFIRMTSNFAIKKPFNTNSGGIAYLPDESFRYLLEQDRLEKLMKNHGLDLVEPIKTVNVANERCMTTLILQKR